LRRSTCVALAAVLLASACSSSSPPSFALTSAAVDASFVCPSGSNNAAYDLHGSVTIHNQTPNSVTVESVSAVMTLVAVKGTWLEHVGDKYDAATVRFVPDSASAGGDTTLALTIPSACTNGKTPESGYGDYRVDLTITTSSGVYSIAARNRHRITLGQPAA
jgi:hypothetical protein